jgi:Tfp pilus assembly protein FimT
MRRTVDTSGFTIIEVIVTLGVTALFLTLFFQVFLTMESQRVSVARQALANDIAYANLRKFATRPTIAPCPDSMDLTTGDPATKPGLLIGDETGSVAAYGFVAEPTDVVRKLGSNIHQSVRAFAPKGCAALATTPIKIEATVSYGSNGDKVVHATYVN